MFGIDTSAIDLDLDDIPSWPLPVKIGSVAGICMLLVALAYFLDFKKQNMTLHSLEKKELVLRTALEKEHQSSVNLPKYEQQFHIMEEMFSELLTQLPDKTEVPGLIEDISKAGIASGLQFRLFDPLDEVRHEFYVELPVKISVVGSYHQLGNFVSRVAGLNRIVTIHEFEVKPYEDATAKQVTQGPTRLLNMKLTAKTYRYINNENK